MMGYSRYMPAKPKPQKLHEAELLLSAVDNEINFRANQFDQLKGMIDLFSARRDIVAEIEVRRAIFLLEKEFETIRTHRLDLVVLKARYETEWRLSIVYRAPGHMLWVCSEFLFPKRILNRIVSPVLSDMREEYFEALSQNRIWKARWVHIRGTYSFFAAVGLDRALAFVSFFVKAWKSVN